MYQTLADLKQALDSGEVSGTVTLDNDETFLYTDGAEVFRMHPYDLLRQALDLLGIPHEEA
jgi:hypothetical protein